MARIATLASNDLLLGRIMKTNLQLEDRQKQVMSEKVSDVYSGLNHQSQRLVILENQTAALERYTSNNNARTLRVKIAGTAVDNVQAIVKDFSKALSNFQTGANKDKTAIRTLQDWAFRSLQMMQGALNTEADGRYVFSGARTGTPPVDFGLTTLENFQATYDGARVTVPTTRDANLENFIIDRSSTGQTNWLTFQRDNGGSPARGRITATTAQFANVAVGSTFTVTGTSSNNGTYTVAAIGGGGTTLDIVTEMLTDEAAGPTLTVTYPDPNKPADTLSLTTTATFNRAAGTITHGGTLNAIPAGSVFTVAGSASNNGSYTVSTNTGGVITIVQKRLTDEGTVGTPFFNFTNTGGNTFTFTNNAAPTKDTIAGPAGTFSSLKAGMSVVLSGTTGATFNGTYTVDSVSTNGATITIRENLPAATATDAAVTINFLAQTAPGTLTSISYYDGDSISTTHRPDANRTMPVDIEANDPAFEKAIRAMQLIAQGAYGTEGGLDQNLTRVSQAVFLVTDASGERTLSPPPFGTELSGDLKSVRESLGYQERLLKSIQDSHNLSIGFLETNIASVENIDPTEAITRLLDDARALEASYKTLARIRELSLVNFI
jgi:flagellin-like hook-associated protein FlgL